MMNETLARLMRAMINYNSGDVHRILLEADFLVNSFEANVPKDGIITFRNNVFRSASAIEMLNDMWNLKYKQVTLNN